MKFSNKQQILDFNFVLKVFELIPEVFLPLHCDLLLLFTDIFPLKDLKIDKRLLSECGNIEFLKIL